MKRKIDICELVKNFDDEFNGRKEWIEMHVALLFDDISHIYDAIRIYKIVDNEWERRANDKVKISYSVIRTTLYESLIYRIMIGLSKIFVGNQEYSLVKTINILSQMEDYRGSEEIQTIIREIQDYIQKSEMISIVTTYRDKFVAHLDKECVMCDCRIDYRNMIERIDMDEIDSARKLIGRLSGCFGDDEERLNHEISKENVIQTFFGNNI